MGDLGFGLNRLMGMRWLGRFMGGMTGSTVRDYYQAFGYQPVLNFEQYLFKYIRQGVAKRIIDLPVTSSWADPPALEGPADYVAAFQNLCASYPVWQKIMVADKLAGIGQFSILVIGVNDGRQLDMPVAKGNGRKLLYLQPYMERNIQIAQFDTDQTSPRFGLPVMYRVQPARIKSTGPNMDIQANWPLKDAFDVHYTRVLHIADNSLENEVYGIPRLEPVFNDLDDLIKVSGGGAETYWLTANRGLQLDVDKDLEMDEDDAKNLEDEAEEYFHNLRRMIRTRGVKINNLGAEVADPSNNVDSLFQVLAAGTGIPQRILFGSEAGQLASQQDRANWAEVISQRRSDFCQPRVLIPLLNRLTGMGILPTITGQINIRWPDAFKLSPLERAQTSAQMARSSANLQKQLAAPPGSVTVQEIVVTNTGGTATIDEKTGMAIPGQPSSTTTVTRTWVEGGTPMFSAEEARQIVGFGKTMPTFDDSNDVPAVVGDD